MEGSEFEEDGQGLDSRLELRLQPQQWQHAKIIGEFDVATVGSDLPVLIKPHCADTEAEHGSLTSEICQPWSIWCLDGAEIFLGRCLVRCRVLVQASTLSQNGSRIGPMPSTLPTDECC